MNNIQLRGDGADVRHVYHRAAELGAWSIDNGRLSASMRSQDVFRLTQQPLMLVVRRPSGADWKWPLSDVAWSGNTLTATVQTAA